METNNSLFKFLEAKECLLQDNGSILLFLTQDDRVFKTSTITHREYLTDKLVKFETNNEYYILEMILD